ncbi:hypothetical protein A0H81_01011 [Grifola frondosa]|uniref:Uncharacterized protein n=1 Tax=Grifola frondosa TaxID=5627 RepID=A0A1C7MQX2_GRIFR|nr:hypothetical protein A0H81_01011 [Grifola frondosa]
MDMDANMDTASPLQQEPQQAMNQVQNIPMDHANTAALTEMDRLYQEMRAVVAGNPQTREPFRDIPVKIHIRRPERDSWAYMGRGIVSQEVLGQSSRVVVRSASNHKLLAAFGEGTALQAEKRGNFIVIGCVEGSRVVSWSLNALNNSETLRLLASIELACYSCKQAVADPHMHNSHRRRIARVIKDDRRRRHKRRKDQDSMVAAFARTGLNTDLPNQQPPDAVPMQGGPQL